jgi:hypothetical protein
MYFLRPLFNATVFGATVVGACAELSFKGRALEGCAQDP